MKQHITKEQLNELSEEQKQKLKDYWWSKLDDVGRWVEEDAHKVIGSDIFPTKEWISIGQMIEFLDEKTNEIGIQFNDSGCYWELWYGGSRKIYYEIPECYELCDALWEAVKEVLNQIQNNNGGSMLNRDQIIKIATEYKEKGPLKLSQEMGLNYPTVVDTVSRLIKHGVKVPRRQSVNPDFGEAVKLLKTKYEK